jgi:hypothetical protein
MTEVRNDWTKEEARALHDLPLTDLLFRAQEVHRATQPRDSVQLCSLLSIKTGACQEDCSYCPQSSKYDTGVEAERLMDVDAVLDKAQEAKDAGASRFCMGAAWRSPKKGSRQFQQVLKMVSGVRELGLEACVTLGMLDDEQTQELKDAGLTAYNHNLDTSEEYYGEIVTTRTYKDRLDTIARVAAAGISVCAGGIIGMGESIDDRVGMLTTLAKEACGLARARSHVRHCAHHDARRAGAAFRRPGVTQPRSAAALLHGGREQHLLWRQAPHDRQPGPRCGPRVAARCRALAARTEPSRGIDRRIEIIRVFGGQPIEFDLQHLAAIKRACSFATATQSTTTRFADASTTARVAETTSVRPAAQAAHAGVAGRPSTS